MFLTAYNLPHYLLSKGIITPESLVAGDFTLAEAGRRNRNFKIMRRSGPGLFVKQIKTTEPQAIMTIKREAAFYQAVQTGDKFAALRPLIPHFLSYDASRHAITMRLIDGAESMQERQTREGVYPVETAQALGRALGIVHTHGTATSADTTLRAHFPCQIPWPLTIDQTGFQGMQSMGAIVPALTAALTQRPQIVQHLTMLKAEWRYDSLIHSDMKWDNCLLKIQAGPLELTLADWELADLGDGAWDVAAVFKEYIMVIAMNAEMRRSAQAANYPTPAELTLEILQPSVRAFWQAYAAARGLAGFEEQAALLRSIRYAAARLILAIIEYLGTAQELGTLGNNMIETASGLLQAPHLGLHQLMGGQRQ